MNRIYVEKKNSKANKPYISMYIDLGYKQMMVSFNDGDIAQLLGVSVKSLYDMEFDTPKFVAEFTSKVGE